MDNLRSGGQAPQAAQIEPKPDYNNYDTGGRREQISGKQNFSTDEHYRDTSRVVDKEYRNTQFPGHRQDQIDSNRSLQKREEAAGDERMKRRLDRMNQISDR